MRGIFVPHQIDNNSISLGIVKQEGYFTKKVTPHLLKIYKKAKKNKKAAENS